MKEELIRTEMLLGRAAIERLQHSHVAVFGIGGVGGYVTGRADPDRQRPGQSFQYQPPDHRHP